MSESKPDLTTSRRGFIKTAIGLGAAVIAASVGAKPLAQGDTEPSPDSPESTQPEINYINPEIAPFINNHPMLINFDEYHRSIAAQETEKQINYYKREKKPEYASLAEIKEDDVIERAQYSLSYQDLINNKANQLGFKNDSFVRRIAPAVIFVESGANEDANIFQLENMIADDIAKELGIDLGEKRKDLLLPGVNTRIALEYMSRLYKVFPDPTLAIWAFNLGESIMSNAIYAYVMSTTKNDSQKEFVKNKFKSQSEKATNYYTGFLKINFINLLQNQEAVDSMRVDLAKHGETFEAHQNYVASVLAGDFIIQETKG